MQDLTTGPVTRHLLKTTGFMLVTMLFQTLYFLIDLYWVGRLGKEAVAAVGIAGNLSFIVLALSQMLGVGTTTAVAHAMGRKDHEEGLIAFNQSQALGILAGLLLLVASAWLRVPYIAAQAADATTARLADDYLKWFVPAMALQFVFAGTGAALRGTGNFRPGMVVASATVVLNMILAPFLIFGWVTGHPYGVAGAAISSLVAVAVGVIWLTSYFFAKDSFLRFKLADWPPQLRIWRKILGVGLPTGVEFGFLSVYLFIVYAISRPFGAEAQAGFGIGMRVVQAGFMPVVALGFAVAPVAGQNFGARQAQRVKDTFKDAARLAMAVMLLMLIVCHVAPKALVGVFSRDAAVVAIGEEYLRIVSWSFLASGVIFVASSMFQAMGNTLPSLAASALRIVLVAVPAVWLSRTPGFQLHWVWYLSVSAIVFQLALSLWLLRREYRRKLNFAMAPSA